MRMESRCCKQRRRTREKVTFVELLQASPFRPLFPPQAAFLIEAAETYVYASSLFEGTKRKEKGLNRRWRWEGRKAKP